MESNPENKDNIFSQERISKNQLCNSEDFYHSFNNYENSISKDSQETIMPKEDSKNKIYINVINDEIPKKIKKKKKIIHLN